MNALSSARIRKAKNIYGKTLVFRNAVESDAEFIISLRCDEKKSRYLSATPDDVSLQKKWLRKYSVIDDQAYFIILINSIAIGTVRIYDCVEDDFSWGSWIIASSAPGHAAIESALMLYAYALDFLKFRRSHFNVRKSNESVCRFHERFGAIKVSENEIDNNYIISEFAIEKSRVRYQKFLPEQIMVDYIN